jgi:(R,R)-butanediol dehydrogenase/meso-butanediol dehydrogenase/diacetyl reductase
MRAVRLHGIGDLRIEEVPAPSDVAPGSALLRVRAVGICGSDLHNFRTGQWISRLPVIPGHELAGEVIEVGTGVEGLRRGDLVVADSRVSCGACRACREGRDNLCERLGYVGEVCDGGFAEFVTLPANRLLRVPAGVPAELAALAEPLGVALHVVHRLAPAPDEPILLAGAGPIGGLAAIALDHLGFGPLLVIERNAERARIIASLTRAVIVPAEAAAIASASGGAPIRHAIEASGSPDLLTVLTRALVAGGRLALVGLYHGPSSVDLNPMVEREIDIVGCSVFRDEQREALTLLAPLREKLVRVLSAPIALEDVPQAYRRLINGEAGALKTIVRPHRERQIEAR